MAKEGILFALGDCLSGVPFFRKDSRQVEASCLDEVFFSLNVEKREALVKVTLGGVGWVVGWVPEKMYKMATRMAWNKRIKWQSVINGFEQVVHELDLVDVNWEFHLEIWTVQSLAILLQSVSAFDSCRLGYIPFVGRPSPRFSCAVFCNSEGLAEEGDLLPFADTGSFFRIERLESLQFTMWRSGKQKVILEKRYKE